jgi:pimeloyl-ACP methyl ester carboxylesterase
VRQHLGHQVGRELEIAVWNGLGQSVFTHERDVGSTHRIGIAVQREAHVSDYNQSFRRSSLRSISAPLIRRLIEPKQPEIFVATTQALKRPLLTIALTLTALLDAMTPAGAQQRATPLKPARTGYVPANGVNYYYEIYGRGARGAPLLVLHGGLGSTAMFEPDLAQLSKGRQVIAVDLHGHGRTALGDRAINYIDMGNDLATVVKQLGYDTVDVLGYSMGGGVGLRLAIQHPEVVRRLVLVSTPYSPSGFYPELLPQQAAVSGAMADAMKETRVRFAPPNDLGVADHDVILGTGLVVHNPIRVVPNGTGSTMTFTLMRQPGVSARQFNQDAETVQRDLETLRTVLEQP